MPLRKPATLKLTAFDISPERGFLPRRDPLATLPRRWPSFLNDLAQALPKLLAARQLRAYIDTLRGNRSTSLGNRGPDELRCAARILSFAGHGYVWEDPLRPADRIPASLAVPWHHVMKKLGRPPVLSYASYALDNWRRLDPTRPIELGNITLLQNFFGGLDEEWFVLVHVDIEAKAGKALAGIAQALRAAHADNPDEVMLCLHGAAAAEEQMHRTLLRMPERCDPYIYYNRVRPYIHGWKDNPSLPRGVVYDGVKDFRGSAQRFRGETGAQSSIIPALDAAFGVPHAEDPLRQYLAEMRGYMPPKHRALIEALERSRDASGRAFLYGYVRDRRERHPKLWEALRNCVRLLARFRETHLDYADRYIHQQHQRSASNPTGVGTGGTPFMTYLKKHLDETERFLEA
jgi:indoleamine 2,3-dioxygenase